MAMLWQMRDAEAFCTSVRGERPRTFQRVHQIAQLYGGELAEDISMSDDCETGTVWLFPDHSAAWYCITNTCGWSYCEDGEDDDEELIADKSVAEACERVEREYLEWIDMLAMPEEI